MHEPFRRHFYSFLTALGFADESFIGFHSQMLCVLISQGQIFKVELPDVGYEILCASVSSIMFWGSFPNVGHCNRFMEGLCLSLCYHFDVVLPSFVNVKQLLC